MRQIFRFRKHVKLDSIYWFAIYICIFFAQVMALLNRLAEEHLDSKIVLLGSAGVGKSSIVRRYVAGRFEEGAAATVGAAYWTKQAYFVIHTAQATRKIEQGIEKNGEFFNAEDIIEKHTQMNNNVKFVDNNKIGVRLGMNIWDTAGQERFRSMGPMYYRGCHTAILVFDLQDEETFKNVKRWAEELKNNDSSVQFVLVANKIDKISQNRNNNLNANSNVAILEKHPLYIKASQFAKENRAKIFLTSAKTGLAIEELFDFVITAEFIYQLNRFVMQDLRSDQTDHDMTKSVSISAQKNRRRNCCSTN